MYPADGHMVVGRSRELRAVIRQRLLSARRKFGTVHLHVAASSLSFYGFGTKFSPEIATNYVKPECNLAEMRESV